MKKYGVDLERVTADITRLYELSLSVGRSQDLESNCAHFLRTLTAMKNLSYAAVWIKRSSLEGLKDDSALSPEDAMADLVYGYPRYHQGKKSVAITHPMFTLARESAPVSVSASQAQFESLITERKIRGGVFALFELGDLGVLKLFTAQSLPFSSWELNQLENVVAKFTLSLEGCLLHQRVLREMAERKIAERELLKSKRQQDSILEGIGDGVIVVNTEGCVVLANPVARAFFRSVGSLEYGSPFTDILERLSMERSDPRALVFKGTPMGLQKVEIEDRILHLIRTPMEEERGEVSGEILVFHDMTREHEVHRLKTEFVSSVSHELRTPLASIKGFTTTILRDPEMPQETRLEFLKIVDEESDRLTELIVNILDLSRIESGRISFLRERLELSGLVKSVVENLRTQFIKAGLRVELPTDSTVEISGDRNQLVLLVTNLLSNALKFTPPGGIVTLGIKADESRTIFEVRDTGMGIPEDEISKIFERFHRVPNQSSQIPGTGLGLAIVQEVVNAHGWSVQVESTLGEGTVFSVTMPRNDPSA